MKRIAKKKMINSIVSFPSIFWLLFFSLIIRLVLYSQGTLFLDFNTFLAWSNRLVQFGFKNFYQIWSDYLPGYLYLLWLLGKIKSLFWIDPLFLYKLPAITADLITGFLIYLIIDQQLKKKKLALIGAGLYLFNPAILANSTLWGQIDSLTSLFSLLAVYLIEINPLLSAVCLSLGTLIKPQVAFVVPIIFFLILKQKERWINLISYILLGAGVFLFGFLPFKPDQQGLINFIWERVNQSLNQYQYTSVNAFNFWALKGFWQPDNLGLLSPQRLGFLTVFLIIILAFYQIFNRARKKNLKEKKLNWKSGLALLSKEKYYLMVIFFLSTFLFLTRMHERHLLPVFAPLVIAGAINPVLWLAYFGLSLTYLANLAYAFVWINQDFQTIFDSSGINLISLLNLGFLGLVLLSQRLKKGIQIKSMSFGPARPAEEKPAEARIRLNPQLAKGLLLLILSFSLFARLINLGLPAKEYFDEVYHAFTARVILNNDPKGWEWWNPHPEGFAYEWTHPPLAKLGMVLGMLVFGENSFGWRIPGALLGTGTILLVYLIAREIFKDELTGILASAAFSLEGLPLVMSRIGMNDTYFLFFCLLTIFLFLKDRYFFSSISLGLAASSKWTTAWLLPILALTHLVLKTKPQMVGGNLSQTIKSFFSFLNLKPKHLFFFFLPPLVYVLSYTPALLTHTPEKLFFSQDNLFIGVQKQMWWYHTRLKAEHAYTSAWWSWPLMLRPVWLFASGRENDLVANIYAMGNPIILWSGVVATLTAIFYSFLDKDKKLGLVIFSYLAFFVTWASSPRIMFFYHYLPAIPFLVIVLARILKKYPKLIPIFFLLSTISFLYFFPHWTGIKVPLWLDQSYYWFNTWR